MTYTITPDKKPLLDAVSAPWLTRWCRRLVLTLFSHLRIGRITLVEGSHRTVFGEQSPEASYDVEIRVHHPHFYRLSAFGGSVGAAEAYMLGYWSSDDLTAVMRVIIRNQAVFARLERGWARAMTPAYRLFHFLRRNTPKGSRENIVAHYDLGNDFYALFLDDTLTYSCGIFETEKSTLRDASVAKYDRICRKLKLTSEDHVLEIGTGWGGFAVHAVRHYGCRVTTTTISDKQYAFAGRRFRSENVADRVELLKKDYRKLNGRFDKLVSIEMIEAVGHHFLDTFLAACSRCLHDNGMMLLQAITIADWVFDQHKHSVDFIKRYIFPGSCIPSVTAICRAAARTSDLRLFHLEDISPHYVRTLSEWRRRFFAEIDSVRRLGYSETFLRMWAYYLCYCEGGFAERYIGDVQMLFTKPLCRREPILPALPA